MFSMNTAMQFKKILQQPNIVTQCHGLDFKPEIMY